MYQQSLSAYESASGWHELANLEKGVVLESPMTTLIAHWKLNQP
jgi:hypothetical protein